MYFMHVPVHIRANMHTHLHTCTHSKLGTHKHTLSLTQAHSIIAPIVMSLSTYGNQNTATVVLDISHAVLLLRPTVEGYFFITIFIPG